MKPMNEVEMKQKHGKARRRVCFVMKNAPTFSRLSSSGLRQDSRVEEATRIRRVRARTVAYG